MMESWHSYPSIFALGHRATQDLLSHEVNVEEKIDGSQFSFGVFNGTVMLKSKSVVMTAEHPETMFVRAADTVKLLAPSLHDGWTYRAEFLQKPRHNALGYERVPNGHLIVFDINTGHEEYLSYEEKAKECERIGLECVPLLFSGKLNINVLTDILTNSKPILGGPMIEGVVIKPTHYNVYGTDKKVVLAKFVSERFKEIHREAWGVSNPGRKDILAAIVDGLRTDARWEKAIQHLRDAGQLTNSPKDIGPLVKEVVADVVKEEADTVKNVLWNHFKGDIQRGVTRGLAEWYKSRLMQEAFDGAEKSEENLNEVAEIA